MRSINSDHRHLKDSRISMLRKRTSVQVIVGALAIAAIVLAFTTRPVQSPLEADVLGLNGGSTTSISAVSGVPAAGGSALQRDRIHQVVQGDTLSSIALKYYGDASKYDKILEANRDILSGPDSLQIGQKLKIPE